MGIIRYHTLRILILLNILINTDTISLKGVWSVEANKELDEYLNSKANFIDLGAKNIRYSSNEAIQSIYDLTKVLSSDISKLSDPVF